MNQMSGGVIIVSLDRRCNNRCRFCSQADLDPERPRSDVTAQLEQAYAAGCRRVDFVGGEPTIHDELPDAIGLARRLGFERIGLQTNGRRMAYRSYTDMLATAGLTHVDVSLHGPTASVHEFHTTVEGSFQQTVTGVGRARAAGLGTAITSVVTRSNVHLLSALAGVIAALDVRQWRVMLAQHVGRVAEDARRIVPRWTTAARYLTGAHRLASASACRMAVVGLPPCIAPTLPRLVDLDLPVQLSIGCRGCAIREICPGVDPGYLALYGDSELRPFSRELERSNRSERSSFGPFDAHGATAIADSNDPNDSNDLESFVGRVGRPQIGVNSLVP
jgi:pyruvate-formate lyase-activating enzyme